MRKILTVVKATGANFIRHYLPYFPGGSKVVHTPKNAFSEIPNFDTILFEWGNDLTAQIINSELFRQYQEKHQFKTIVRVHDHEVTKFFGNQRRIDKINWSRVDHIWFINPIVQHKFIELKGFEEKTFFLPNAVDPELFPEHQANTKKVGLVSLYFRQRKRIDRIVEIAKLLPDWEFDIRVEIPFQSPGSEYQNEYNKLRKLAEGVDNIYLENRLVTQTERTYYENSDLVRWYQDKAVILSLSDWEGFHYAIGEGLCSGCLPIVWNWPGSDVFWGPYVVENAEQAAERIANYEPSDEYRQYVRDHYHPKMLTEKLLKHIA